jgi:putative phosphoesterase
MKIGLLSDTHGYLDPVILTHFKDCDEIWHAGDMGTMEVMKQLEAFKPTVAVYGNIEGKALREKYPLNQFFEREGLKIWMTHIAGYPGRYQTRIQSGLKSNPVGLFICGHSHILKVMKDQTFGHLHMNPGAAGVQGFHKVRTVLRFEINSGRPQNLEVIELHPRSMRRI